MEHTLHLDVTMVNIFSLCHKTKIVVFFLSLSKYHHTKSVFRVDIYENQPGNEVSKIATATLKQHGMMLLI